MDRMIYLAMNGREGADRSVRTRCRTTWRTPTPSGFRADLMAFRSVPVRAEDTATTRVFALEATAGFNDPGQGRSARPDNPLDVGDPRRRLVRRCRRPTATRPYTRNGNRSRSEPEGALLTARPACRCWATAARW
jgi:flagellar basal body rod protein FlgF